MFRLRVIMRIRLLYLATALVGFYWSVSLALVGQYGAPSSFWWWSTVLFTGSLLLAGCAVLRWTSKWRWAKWPAVVGSGILTIYFIPAAIMTLRGYARGEAIASPAHLGSVLALVVPVVVSLTVALRNIRTPEKAP